jgi:hypothetical protein
LNTLNIDELFGFSREAAIRERRPFRIISQVPIMHSPGEISHVASMVDPRIFDEPSSITDVAPNIEFHIHAFLNP